MTSSTALVVGTDGSPAQDQRVREAARLAHARNVPLHVVCCVERAAGHAQREFDRCLPSDMAHLAGHGGQCAAAVAEVRTMLAYFGVDVRVTTSAAQLKPAVKAAAKDVGGLVYGTEERAPRFRIPGLQQRVVSQPRP